MSRLENLRTYKLMWQVLAISTAIPLATIGTLLAYSYLFESPLIRNEITSAAAAAWLTALISLGVLAYSTLSKGSRSNELANHKSSPLWIIFGGLLLVSTATTSLVIFTVDNEEPENTVNGTRLRLRDKVEAYSKESAVLEELNSESNPLPPATSPPEEISAKKQ